MLIMGAWIAGGLVYTIGFCVSMNDVLENGPSLEDFRKKYGKDLGVTLCGFHHGLKSAGWPVFGGVKFVIGLIRDTITLIVTSRPKSTEE